MKQNCQKQRRVRHAASRNVLRNGAGHGDKRLVGNNRETEGPVRALKEVDMSVFKCDTRSHGNTTSNLCYIVLLLFVAITFNFCASSKYILPGSVNKPTNPTDKNWELLVNYWKIYLNNPNPKNSNKILEILVKEPKSGPGNEKNLYKYSCSMEQIKKDLNLFLTIIRTGQPHAIRLTFKLLNHPDFRDRFPYEVFGFLVKKHPLAFLTEFKRMNEGSHEGNPIHYSIINYTNIEITGTVDEEIQEMNERIKVLKNVKDKNLIAIRDSLVKGLFDRIKVVKNRGNIPKNLKECFIRLKEIFLEEGTLEQFIQCYRKGAYHAGIGMWMRNNWGLWNKNTKLWKYFDKLGIFHADDMSGIIMDTFWCHLKNQPIKLHEHVQFYKNYWQYGLEPKKESFPTKDLIYICYYACEHPTNEEDFCCSIHIYHDFETGIFWLYGLEKGWRVVTKDILDKDEELQKIIRNYRAGEF